MISLKYKLYIIFFIFILSFLFSYPNFYGENPSIIIPFDNYKKNDFFNLIESKLHKEKFNFYSIDIEDRVGLVIRFKSTDEQFNCYEYLKKNGFSNISLNILESKNISRFKFFGIRPMKMGLDLRGGIHLVVKININNNVNNNLKVDIFDFIKFLSSKNCIYKKIKVRKNNTVLIKFDSDLIKLDESIFDYVSFNFNVLKKGRNFIIVSFNKKKFLELRKQVVEQTIFVFNRRINELGISDSLVVSRGKDNIVIEISGIQDIDRAKKILGKTATLKFMLVESEKTHDSYKIFSEELNKIIFLKPDIILTGESIVNASASFENTLNKPCINVKISSKNVEKFEEITRKNIGKLMAIIYKESVFNFGKEEIKEKIISVATIMSSLSREFQITGLSSQESKDLALLLRSGSLPAAVFISEEKLIGPTIGEENINDGFNSVLYSFFVVFLFMMLKYKRLGLISNFVLVLNILMLVAIMSIIGVTLTLPGLAGISVTIAMSIDGNILIFERIIEEFSKKNDLIYSIKCGFDGAYSSIVDSNLTTLIVGLVLFMLGDGPVKGFAMTLCIGILTSMFSSIFITKSIIDFLYFKKVKLL